MAPEMMTEDAKFALGNGDVLFLLARGVSRS